MAAHGPDAVAFYASGQLLTEEYYVAGKLAKGFIGTNNFDTNSRLCMASAAVGYARSLGADGPPPAYADLEQADCFFLIGTNTADCHPILWKRLVKRKLAMKNLAARQPILFFQIKRRNDLVRQNQFGQIRRILRERLHYGLAESLALLFPVAFQLIGRVLHVNRHHMLAFWRKRRIRQ